MSKKQVLKVLNIIEYALLIIATVAVLTSQFLPYLSLVLVGMSAYVVAFFLSGIRALVNCVEVFRASKYVNEENGALIVKKDIEVLNSKKEKVQAVLNSILWVSLFVFALVVLILYPKAI